MMSVPLAPTMIAALLTALLACVAFFGVYLWNKVDRHSERLSGVDGRLGILEERGARIGAIEGAVAAYRDTLLKQESRLERTEAAASELRRVVDNLHAHLAAIEQVNQVNALVEERLTTNRVRAGVKSGLAAKRDHEDAQHRDVTVTHSMRVPRPEFEVVENSRADSRQNAGVGSSSRFTDRDRPR